MSQIWPLSQDENKASGSCSVCHATRQLHHRDGTVHRHGPRDRPCPGSNRPPLNALSQPAGASRPKIDNSCDLPSAAMPNCQSPFWTPPEHALIKHIPKSARPACATHLTSILRSLYRTLVRSLTGALSCVMAGLFYASLNMRAGATISVQN